MKATSSGSPTTNAAPNHDDINLMTDPKHGDTGAQEAKQRRKVLREIEREKRRRGLAVSQQRFGSVPEPVYEDWYPEQQFESL